MLPSHLGEGVGVGSVPYHLPCDFRRVDHVRAHPLAEVDHAPGAAGGWVNPLLYVGQVTVAVGRGHVHHGLQEGHLPGQGQH